MHKHTDTHTDIEILDREVFDKETLHITVKIIYIFKFIIYFKNFTNFTNFPNFNNFNILIILLISIILKI